MHALDTIQRLNETHAATNRRHADVAQRREDRDAIEALDILNERLNRTGRLLARIRHRPESRSSTTS